MKTTYPKPLMTEYDQISDHYDGSGDPDGVLINCYRYGNVVTVSCGQGRLRSELNAQATIATLKDQFKPTATLSSPDYGTDGTRVRILTNGIIQAMVAKNKYKDKSGNDVMPNVIFCATYVVGD